MSHLSSHEQILHEVTLARNEIRQLLREESSGVVWDRWPYKYFNVVVCDATIPGCCPAAYNKACYWRSHVFALYQVAQVLVASVLVLYSQVFGQTDFWQQNPSYESNSYSSIIVYLRWLNYGVPLAGLLMMFSQGKTAEVMRDRELAFLSIVYIDQTPLNKLTFFLIHFFMLNWIVAVLIVFGTDDWMAHVADAWNDDVGRGLILQLITVVFGYLFSYSDFFCYATIMAPNSFLDYVKVVVADLCFNWLKMLAIAVDLLALVLSFVLFFGSCCGFVTLMAASCCCPALFEGCVRKLGKSLGWDRRQQTDDETGLPRSVVEIPRP